MGHTTERRLIICRIRRQCQQVLAESILMNELPIEKWLLSALLQHKRKSSKKDETEKEDIEAINSGCHQSHEAWRS